jgi:folate-dependent phosphoribosylglycinamide formyltransferase PurN
MQSFITNYLSDIKDDIPKNKYNPSDTVDLGDVLSSFFEATKWEIVHEQLAEKLARKVEITKKFDDTYTIEWKKHKDSQIASSFLSSLATFVLYVSFKKLQEVDAPNEELFKRMNAILKALVVSKEPWIVENSTLHNDIKKDFELLAESLLTDKEQTFKNMIDLTQPKKEDRIVPITVLYFEGPIARAYLEMFKSLGLKPKKIIHMISSVDISTQKPIGKLLPLKYRIKYAAYSQETKINFYPREIEKRYPELQQAIFKEVSKKYNLSNDILKSTTNKLEISQYCENIETIFVTGLKDKKLEDKIIEGNEGTILYTGGGIVPPSLLSILNTKFIHIHPGYLPDIKGADCTLWSTMLFGRASATCFFMSPGIDTGDIIMPRWMPELFFDIQKKKYDDKTLYRAIYSYLDPWVRAVVLREFLTTHKEFKEIKTIKQNETDGYTFYFMHNEMKRIALNRFIN